jgi:hypothetical protein
VDIKRRACIPGHRFGPKGTSSSTNQQETLGTSALFMSRPGPIRNNQSQGWPGAMVAQRRNVFRANQTYLFKQFPNQLYQHFGAP